MDILGGFQKFLGFLFCFHSRQVHLGKDHMSFKLRKDLTEERQKAYNKYKVRIPAALGSVCLIF